MCEVESETAGPRQFPTVRSLQADTQPRRENNSKLLSKKEYYRVCLLLPTAWRLSSRGRAQISFVVKP